MKYKDLKLGKKLALGFGLIILIAILLGSLAIINMQRISSKSQYLADEYIPEVEISSNVELYTLLTMYEIMGYTYTEENSFLNRGKNYIQKLNRYLDEASNLANSSTNLEKLKESFGEIETEANTFEQLIEQTVEANQKFANLRSSMDLAADQFMKNCFSFLESQNRVARKEIAQNSGNIEERYSKIAWINDVIKKGNAMRIANFKSQAKRDITAYQNAINEFNIENELQLLRTITKQNININELNSIESAGKQYKNMMQNFLETWKAIEEINKQKNDVSFKLLENTHLIADSGIEETTRIANEAVELLGSSSIIMIIGLLLAIVLGVLSAYSITNLITTPIKKGVDFAKAIADGDLTAKVDVDQKDEVGILTDALRQMVEKIESIVSSIIEGADNIASASMDMSTTSQQMSQGANEQAASAEEASSSIEQMSANIQQNTDNARTTEKIALKAAEGVESGNKASQKAVISMKDIAEKISIINEIAFQTNILALNAAVEAARAGEHGKGFAVVAAEVRKLAERSAKAAKEIDDVSQGGVTISENAGKLLTEIMPEIEKTSKLVQEIAAASIEQTTGTNQVNTAIQQLNQVTQQNAAAAEEMATSSEELSSQAQQLKDIVSYFKIKEDLIKMKTSSLGNLKKKTTFKTDNKPYEQGTKIEMKNAKLSDEEYENF